MYTLNGVPRLGRAFRTSTVFSREIILFTHSGRMLISTALLMLSPPVPDFHSRCVVPTNRTGHAMPERLSIPPDDLRCPNGTRLSVGKYPSAAFWTRLHCVIANVRDSGCSCVIFKFHIISFPPASGLNRVDFDTFTFSWGILLLSSCLPPFHFREATKMIIPIVLP